MTGPRITESEADRTHFGDVCDACGGTVEPDRKPYHVKDGHRRNYNSNECRVCEKERLLAERRAKQESARDALADSPLQVDSGEHSDGGFG